MHPLTLRSTRRIRVAVIAVAWTLLSAVMSANSYLFIRDLESLGKLGGSYPFLPDFAGTTIIALVGGVIGGYLLVYRLNSGRRHRSFMSDIVRAGVGFMLIFTGAVAGLVFSLAFGAELVGRSGLRSAVSAGLHNIVANIWTPSFGAAMLLWSLIVVGTQFMLQVNDKFGPGVLWKLITGRYYHPREEERVFMFLDLKSSTSIAEKLGHRRFFEFLRDVFQDITLPVAECGGEIYQYVGDQVVLSWPPQRGIRDANCVRCFFEVEEALNDRQSHYLERFGVMPAVRAGIHIGPATVGEIGVIKKDIVYSGDVLNTTARIQGECRRYQVGLLASEDVIGHIDGGETFHAISIGGIPLRGKSEPLELSVVLPA